VTAISFSTYADSKARALQLVSIAVLPSSSWQILIGYVPSTSTLLMAGR